METITVRITQDQVQGVNHVTEFPDHRKYVEERFRELGFEVTSWRYNIVPSLVTISGNKVEFDPDGIKMRRTDSDENMVLEFTGIVGKSLRRIHANTGN